MKPSHNKKNKKTTSLDTENTTPAENVEKSDDLVKKVQELDALNTQLAANLFLRTTSLGIQRDEATKKCEELKSQVATLQGFVDRYAAVNDNLLRDGSTKKSVAEDKEREILSKTQELTRVKLLLSQEITRREELEEECHEMALQIKATERETEDLQRKLADAERRASTASATKTIKATGPVTPPAMIAEMNALKQKEIILTQSLKQATNFVKEKSLELTCAQAALERKALERKFWLLLCFLIVCIHIVSHWTPALSFTVPFPLPTAVKNLTSTIPVNSNRGMFNCVDIMQCTAQ